MNQWIIFLAVVALIALALFGWRRFYLYTLLRRLVISYPAYREISAEQVPSEVALVLEETAKPLQALGFVEAGWQECVPALKSRATTFHYCRHYVHYGTNSFAYLLPQESPDAGSIAVTVFETHLRDGRVIATFNRRRHMLLALPDNYLLDDGYFDNVEAQWALHCRRIAEFQGERISEYGELTVHNETLGRQIVDYWRSSGLVQPAGENLWQLSVRGALGYMRKLLAAAKQNATLPPIGETVSCEARIAADLIAYRAYEQQHEQGGLGQKGKMVLFAISALLGALAFGLAFSWQIVPVLLGVLLFHEFGHALAMRATGYRNVHVLVIPLLGAVASGRKDDAGPWARLIVLLAGPLPGLLIAVAILHAIADQPANHPVLLQIGLMALAINLFNLLPFTPLDGGQIVETFLFSRWPRLRFPFFVASGLALAAMALWLDSAPLLGFALFLLLLSRRLSVTYRLAREIGAQPRETATRAIFAALHRQETAAWRGFVQRLQTVRSVLPLLLSRPPRAAESLLGAAIYVAAIAVPVASLSNVPAAQQLYGRFFADEQVVQDVNPDWEQQLAKAATVEERWSILNKAAQWEEDENYEIDAANQRYRQALAVAQGFAADDVRIIDMKIAVARTTQDEMDALAQYRALLGEVAQLQGKNSVRHAEVLEALHSLDSEAPPTAHVAYLRKAIMVREGLDKGDRFRLASDYEELARVHASMNESLKAENNLRLAVAVNQTASQSLPLVWLLIDQGRAAEAETLLRSHQRGIKKSSWQEMQLADALAWALLLQNKRDEGYQELERAVALTEPGEGWHRYYLMLDLIKFSGDDLTRRTHWRAKVKRELVEEGIGARSLIDGMSFYGSYLPWDELRRKARLESLTTLGLAQEDPEVGSCR